MGGRFWIIFGRRLMRWKLVFWERLGIGVKCFGFYSRLDGFNDDLLMILILRSIETVGLVELVNVVGMTGRVVTGVSV